MIDYPAILERTETRAYRWTDRDVMLYALAVGMGEDPLDPDELPFVYESGLRVMPSFATVAAPRAGARLLIGLDYAQVVDAERTILLHRPLPASASIEARSRVSDVIDRGEGRGALVRREVVLHEEGEEEPLATIFVTTFARGDGGTGRPSGPTDTPPPRPDRPADRTVALATRPNQALLYRLCGDRNPLHADPEAARRAGFQRPILQGMCTFGMACRALLKSVTKHDPHPIAAMSARFTAPVYPGETVSFDLWLEPAAIVFEARVAARDMIVLQGGRVDLRG